MSKKPPRLDEVFLVNNRNTLNVGSSYGRPTAKFGAFRMREAAMKPELEKVVGRYSREIAQGFGGAQWKGGGSLDDVLRKFAHEMEGAEGEDPAELDQGGPKPGTTGGQ